MALAGCALPSRDNPSDPANAPVAALRVVEVDRTDGGCGPIGDFGARGAVGAASRGRCLVLDARGTTDPQDTEAQKQVQTYAFATAAECGGELPFDASAYQGTAGVVAIKNEYLRQCTPGEPIEFTVTATDPDGARNQAATFFTPLNSSPLPRIENAPRTIPLGGFPWAPGAPVAVDFRGAYEDLDDDPVTFAWSFSGLVIGTASVATPSIVIGDLTTPSRIIATLVVRDGSSDSDAVSQVVYVRESPEWERTGSETQTVRRVDGSFRTIIAGGASGTPRAVLLRGTSPIVAIVNSIGELVTTPWPPSTLFSPVTSLFSNSVEIAATADGRVWVAGVDPMSAAARVIAFDRSGSTLVPAGIDLSEDGTNALADSQSHLSVDDDGNPWVTSFGSYSVVRFDGSGVNPAIIVTPGGLVAAVAARPGSGEVWILTVPDYLFGTPGDPTATLHIYSTSAAELQPPIALPWEYGFALAWSDAASLWTHASSKGLVRLDAEMLLAGADPETTIRTLSPDVLGANGLVIDPLTGDCWTGDFANLSWQVSPGGTTRPFDVGNEVLPQFVDDVGALWFARGNSLLLASSPDRENVGAEFTRSMRGSPSIDLAHAGVWTPIYFPPSIEFHAEDGSTRRSFAAMTSTAGTVLVPQLTHFRVAPDGESAWYLDTTSLAHVDLRSDPPVMKAVAPVTVGATFIQRRTTFLEAGAPQVGSPDFAWFIRADDASASVWTATSTDVVQKIYDLPPYLAEEPFTGSGLSPQYAGAVSWNTNAVCVAMRDQPDLLAGIGHLLYVPFGGPGSELGTLPIPADPSSMEIFAGVSSDALGDVCWIAYSNQGGTPSWSVRAYDSTGILVHELLGGSGVLTSISPRGTDDLRITRTYDIGSGPQHARERYVFSGLSAVSVVDNPILELPMKLVAPGAP